MKEVEKHRKGQFQDEGKQKVVYDNCGIEGTIEENNEYNEVTQEVQLIKYSIKETVSCTRNEIVPSGSKISNEIHKSHLSRATFEFSDNEEFESQRFRQNIRDTTLPKSVSVTTKITEHLPDLDCQSNDVVRFTVDCNDDETYRKEGTKRITEDKAFEENAITCEYVQAADDDNFKEKVFIDQTDNCFTEFEPTAHTLTHDESFAAFHDLGQRNIAQVELPEPDNDVLQTRYKQLAYSQVKSDCRSDLFPTTVSCFSDGLAEFTSEHSQNSSCMSNTLLCFAETEENISEASNEQTSFDSGLGTSLQSLDSLNTPSASNSLDLKRPPLNFEQVIKNILQDYSYFRLVIGEMYIYPVWRSNFERVLSRSTHFLQQMEFEYLRLSSFGTYTGQGSSIRLARNGFHSEPRIGPTATRCFKCRLVVSDWTFFDNVAAKHCELSPNCTFVTRRNSEEGNESIFYEGRATDSITQEPHVNTWSSNCATALPAEYSAHRACKEVPFTRSAIQDSSRESPGASSESIESQKCQEIEQPQTVEDRGNGSSSALGGRRKESAVFSKQQEINIQPAASSIQPNDNITAITRNESNSGSSETLMHLEIVDNQELVEAPKYPNYSALEVRIRSFRRWPSSHVQTARQMAEAGFFFTGSSDLTCCYCCGGGLLKWETGDDPVLEHLRWFPYCEYARNLNRIGRGRQEHEADLYQPLDDAENRSLPILCGREKSNIAQASPPTRQPENTVTAITRNESNSGSSESLMHLEIVDNPDFVEAPKYPNYANLEARIRSFRRWPSSYAQTTRQMAEAGFYFEDVPDIVRCFCCGRSLQAWETGDDPLLEHVRWFPDCEYANKLKNASRWGRRGQEHEVEQYQPVEDADNRSPRTLCLMTRENMAQPAAQSRELGNIVQPSAQIKQQESILSALWKAIDPLEFAVVQDLISMGYSKERMRDIILERRRASAEQDAPPSMESVATQALLEIGCQQQSVTDAILELRRVSGYV